MGKCEYISLAIILSVVAVLVVIIVVPMSFADIHYYEYGIKKQRSTGSVDLSKIYTSGRHFVGPDYTFKTFRADAHFVDLDKVEVWTNDKVAVTITCTFQYFLRKDHLAELHRVYDVAYKPVVKSTAIAAIKGRAAQLPIDKYIRDREAIEKELFKTLLKTLDGCCRSKCKATICAEFKICKDLSSCKTEELGIFIEVKYFQLHDFDIHEDVKSRSLRQVIEAAEEERVIFEQQEQLVLRETETLINQIDNEATIIAQNASANAAVILSKARAQALTLVENARTEGLKNLYTSLGISAAKGNFTQKASLIYLRTLRNKKNVSLNVNYKSILLKE